MPRNCNNAIATVPGEHSVASNSTHAMTMPSSPASAWSGLRTLVVGLSLFPDAMEWHVVDTLRLLGSDVRLFECDRIFGGVTNLLGRAVGKALALTMREPERRSESRLIRAVREHDPQLVLVLLGKQISPKTVASLRRHTQAPIVCWCQDAITSLGRQYVLGAGYDAVFVKDRYMQDLFSRMIRSTSFHYLPEACNPRVHRTVMLSERDLEEYGCDIMIAGNVYYYRQEILLQLAPFRLKVWGGTHDWMIDRLAERHQRRVVLADDKARAAGGARIALNTLHYAEINGLNCRAFELAGCGAFQLVSSVPVLAEHFVPDQEVVTFSTVEELIEKAHFYLRHPQLAQQIAQRGQARAYRDHTYERRLNELVSKVLPGRDWARAPLPSPVKSVQLQMVGNA